MSLLEKLAINKKITAFFADGSQKMNLGVAAVVDLLKGTERVQVQIAPVKRAERLLTDLAESAGCTIQKVEEGTFLAQSESPEPWAASPEPEPFEAPVEVAQPEAEVVILERAADGNDLTLTDPVWRNATCDERSLGNQTDLAK
jgi:hypothetical protein